MARLSVSRQKASVISSLVKTPEDSGSRKASNESDTRLFSEEGISWIVNFLQLKKIISKLRRNDLKQIFACGDVPCQDVLDEVGEADGRATVVLQVAAVNINEDVTAGLTADVL